MATESRAGGLYAPFKNWKSTSARAAIPSEESCCGCFDCNICFDSAHEPVVTLCGHLYCWPCIYQWLHVQSTPREIHEQQRPSCPVCKANVSADLLVPLYGRGKSSSESNSRRAPMSLMIPRRPPPSVLQAYQFQQLHHTGPPFHHHPYRTHTAMTMPSLGGSAMMSIYHPMMGMFGELLFATIFRNFPTNASSTAPRMRRQEIQLEKSLNRVTAFLFCCIILCLILF